MYVIAIFLTCFDIVTRLLFVSSLSFCDKAHCRLDSLCYSDTYDIYIYIYYIYII